MKTGHLPFTKGDAATAADHRMRVILAVIGIGIFANGPAGGEELRATRQHLLKTGVVTALAEPTTFHLRAGDVYFSTGSYKLVYESALNRSFGGGVRVRVWSKAATEWINPQVIQLLNESRIVLAAREVGGVRTMMTEAWTTAYRDSLFVYIKCRDLSRSQASPTFIYQVGPDLQIKDSGVYFDRVEIEAEERSLMDGAVKELNRLIIRKKEGP